MPKGFAGFPRPGKPPGRLNKPLIAGTWAPASTIDGTSISAGAPMNTLIPMCTPLYFGANVLIDGWYTKVATAQTAGTVEVALYTMAPSGRPDERIARLGLVDASTTGHKQVACNPTFIPAGDVMACFLTTVASVAMVVYTTGHSGVRLTDPDVFVDYSTVGLTFTISTNVIALPPRFMGTEPLNASSSWMAPFIVFRTNKVLSS